MSQIDNLHKNVLKRATKREKDIVSERMKIIRARLEFVNYWPIVQRLHPEMDNRKYQMLLYNMMKGIVFHQSLLPVFDEVINHLDAKQSTNG